jgi:opacity protein-like surface antigen
MQIMKNRVIFAAAVAAITAGPALAGGVAEPAPAPVTVAPAPPPVVGNDWSGPSVGVQLGYGYVSTSGPSLDGDDVLLGLRAYYDVDFGDFIVGGGLQYDATDLNIGGATRLESVTRLGLRAGVDLGTNWIYGTAGWARAETSSLGRSDGWFAGVGYEVMVASNVSVGAEVLYHEFDDFNLPGLEARATTAAISVNFRF